MNPTPELRNPAEVRCTAAPLPRGEGVQTLGGGALALGGDSLASLPRCPFGRGAAVGGGSQRLAIVDRSFRRPRHAISTRSVVRSDDVC